MNPDKCARCHQMVDPFDPEYCVWDGQRWHVSCAIRQANDNIETMREKQGRHNTTAANYSTLQAKIDDMIDQRKGLMNIMRGVPQQAQDLGMIFMRCGEKLVRRKELVFVTANEGVDELESGKRLKSGGHLLKCESDSRYLFGIPGAERDEIEQGNKNLLEDGSDGK